MSDFYTSELSLDEALTDDLGRKFLSIDLTEVRELLVPPDQEVFMDADSEETFFRFVTQCITNVVVSSGGKGFKLSSLMKRVMLEVSFITDDQMEMQQLVGHIKEHKHRQVYGVISSKIKDYLCYHLEVLGWLNRTNSSVASSRLIISYRNR